MQWLRVLNCPAETAVSTMSADNAVEAAVAEGKTRNYATHMLHSKSFRKGSVMRLTTAAMCDAPLQAVLRTYFISDAKKH